MSAVTSPTPAPTPARRAPTELTRFDGTERFVHWSTATLMLVLIATGAAMYAGPISTLVGRRLLVRTIHVYSGFLLPLPLLFALVTRRRGAALRADVSELNRFDADDRRWLSPRRHATARPAKFNAGQKLNAAFLAAAGLVMLGTGMMMYWHDHFEVDLRTGATFVHDWFAIGIWIAVIGHIAFALRDPESRRGMLRGHVPAHWARVTHPRWYERVVATNDARKPIEGRTTRSVGSPGDQPNRRDAHPGAAP